MLSLITTLIYTALERVWKNHLNINQLIAVELLFVHLYKHNYGQINQTKLPSKLQELFWLVEVRLHIPCTEISNCR